MSKEACHGCDGKGWVMVTVRETVMPFIDNRNQPVDGLSRAVRDCEPRTCPVCHGKGSVSRVTIGDAVNA